MSASRPTRLTSELRLAEVRIQDYRAIKHLWMPLGESTVLLGENNAGKTCLLTALDVALGDQRPSAEDFHMAPNGHSAQVFVVDVLFRPVSGEEFSETIEQIVGDAVQIGLGTEVDYFAIRTRVEIDSARRDPTLRRCFLKNWQRERVAAGNIEELRSPFVTREILDLLPFHLLDARRDIVEQMRNRRTHWGKLLSDFGLTAELRAELELALAVLREKIVTGSPPLSQLEKDLSEIASILAQPGASIKIAAIPGDIRDLLRNMDVVISDTAHGVVSVGQQGMGTRSLAALIIFRSYVHAAVSSGLVQPIAAFEEPEAHLHPHGQRSVLNVLRTIPVQRIISTHSPYIASIADVYDFRIFRRTQSGTQVTWVDEKNSLGQPTFGSDELTSVRRFVQKRNGEVLFARVVVLFEGDTEDAALPVFASAFWPEGADAQGVSLINVGGAGNYKHIVVFLEKMGIPWLIFSDGDNAGKQGVMNAGKAIGRSLDENSSEIVMLPNGNDFEAYMISEGLLPHAERAIKKRFGPTALSSYRNKTNGLKKKNEEVRDYDSLGWETRLISDFMDTEKGKYGADFAEEVIADLDSQGVPRFPSCVRKLFELAKTRLENQQ